jgi:Ni/Co efflux regulator RcnB
MVAPAPAPRAPTYQPAPGYRPAPRPAPSLPSSGPETVRRYNGVGGPAYARHYGGGENGAPRLGRNPRGPAYVYHGRTYAPVVAGRYRWPRGYGYHRFHRHERFPRVFLIPDYFIADYYDYGLAQPPPDAQWVRYGDDLVLVDLDTDEILDTIPGFFADEGDGGDAGPPDYGDQGPPPDEGPPPPDAAPY